jgi:L-lactate dehydrogenase complex protein LldF
MNFIDLLSLSVFSFVINKVDMKSAKNFLFLSEEKSFSEKHRQTIRFNISKYDEKVKEGKKLFDNLELARQTAKNIKWFAMENLPALLEQFERQFTSNGGKIIWAENATEALTAIENIIKAKEAKTVVKSKSMITEEIELNPFLEKMGIEVLETDLGEYIVQLRNEAPYHIVTPAMHLSKEEIAELFYKKFNTAPDASPEEITAFVRKLLREKFENADIGITGANFLIADSGSIAITENEGNARLSSTFPKIHIAIAGIEKILPKLNDLELFWPLLSTFGTGQQLTVYNSIISGPKKENEVNGPEEMYLILLDNGRSNLLADVELREALYCIRCGSCLNACPVYRTIGGHSYESPYSGPIGAVIMPPLKDYEEFNHLSEASSLCGACTENCPLNINLHKMLLVNRREAVKRKAGIKNRTIWFFWKKLMLNRGQMNNSGFLKNLFAKIFLKKAWGKRREFPEFRNETFNELWKKGKV